jgi:hypothetical protein
LVFILINLSWLINTGGGLNHSRFLDALEM